MKDSIFEYAKKDFKSHYVPEVTLDERYIDNKTKEKYFRSTPSQIPAIAESDIVRYYTTLAHKNFSVDTHFYPLGSCTMKYNPKVNEAIAGNSSFTKLHPYQSVDEIQGILEVGYLLGKYLCEITGLDSISLTPSAGAHGELSGAFIARAYFEYKGEKNRNIIVIPDTAHGTNPASASMANFQIKTVRTAGDGTVSISELNKALDEKVAMLMITNPNTLGIFEKNIKEIADLAHSKGILVYMDGANLNALMGITRPGDFGVDILHINLHKTFSTPHGGGGPGGGGIAVKKFLEEFLPVPVIDKKGDKFILNYELKNSIGRIKAFYGHTNIWIRALAYILSLGKEGLKEASKIAVLNANYLASKLKEVCELPYSSGIMHEFVLSGRKIAEGVRTLDIAKRLLDYEYHAPTIYFPLIVQEALMIEPTETESKETLDRFCNVLFKIIGEAKTSPELVKEAPHNLFVSRVDEVRATKTPILRYRKTRG